MSGLEASMIKAQSAEKKGDFSEAERLYQAILTRFPRNSRARSGLDTLHAKRAAATLRADAPPQPVLDQLADLYQRGQLAQVVLQAQAVLGQHPRSAFVHNLLAAAQLGLGQPAQAEASLRAAQAQGVSHPALSNNLGMALAQLGRHGEAIDAYHEAAVLNPRYATARNNLGNSLKELGRLAEALDAYETAVAIEPNYADALNNMALVLARLGRSEEARAAYLAALKLQPGHAGALNNLGNLLADLGDLAGAIARYEAALLIDTSFSDAHFNLGNAWKRQGRTAEANAAYERARATRADQAGSADIWTEQGRALALEGRLDQAVAAFDQALAGDPGHKAARLHSLFYRAQVCDWSAFSEFVSDPALDGAVSPFALLPFEDDPARQLARSRAWTAASVGPVAATRPAARQGQGKIRIGYFSADFHDHATMVLLSGVLRAHDRSRFEIHCFGFGPQSGRCDLADSFTDISAMPDAAAIALVRDMGIDIAVDLKGHTQGARPRLFAGRLAPLQVGWLGYPGSTGADFIDYMIADEVVIPTAERAFYDEKLLLLPGSYQPNDNQRPIAQTATTRADFGLPENAFVFASFNQNYKITPREFAIWMRLLGRVEGSVLWLMRSNRWADANLRAEAEKCGISADRLIFADSLPHAEHLARHRHADLFLDSFAVGAHTTASDALWAGLPLVTLAGRQFAARVAASLLHAVGLPELVTEDEAGYEALCLDLATSPERLDRLRAKLAANRLTHPLFDTAGFARNLEAAYSAAWARHIGGQAPDDITISAAALAAQTA